MSTNSTNDAEEDSCCCIVLSINDDDEEIENNTTTSSTTIDSTNRTPLLGSSTIITNALHSTMSNTNDADDSSCIVLSIHDDEEGIENASTTRSIEESTTRTPLLSSSAIITNDDVVEVDSDTTIPISNPQDIDSSSATLHDDATIPPARSTTTPSPQQKYMFWFLLVAPILIPFWAAAGRMVMGGPVGWTALIIFYLAGPIFCLLHLFVFLMEWRKNWTRSTTTGTSTTVGTTSGTSTAVGLPASEYHVSSPMAKILRAYILCHFALQLFMTDDGGGTNTANSIMNNWLRLPEILNDALLLLFAGAVIVIALVLLIFSIFEDRWILVHVTDATISSNDAIDGSPLLADVETSDPPSLLTSAQMSAQQEQVPMVQKILFWLLVISPIVVPIWTMKGKYILSGRSAGFPNEDGEALFLVPILVFFHFCILLLELKRNCYGHSRLLPSPIESAGQYHVSNKAVVSWWIAYYVFHILIQCAAEVYSSRTKGYESIVMDWGVPEAVNELLLKLCIYTNIGVALVLIYLSVSEL